MITILNTSILTEFGNYVYREITLKEAQELLQEEYASAVGHESTCEVLSRLLLVEVPVNRIQYSQLSGTSALVFKLNGRIPEGKILTRDEIEQIGYKFGLLTRVE